MDLCPWKIFSVVTTLIVYLLNIILTIQVCEMLNMNRINFAALLQMYSVLYLLGWCITTWIRQNLLIFQFQIMVKSSQPIRGIMSLWILTLEINTVKHERYYKIVESLGIYCNRSLGCHLCVKCVNVFSYFQGIPHSPKKIQWRSGALGRGNILTFIQKQLEGYGIINSELLVLVENQHTNMLAKLEFMSKPWVMDIQGDI